MKIQLFYSLLIISLIAITGCSKDEVTYSGIGEANTDYDIAMLNFENGNQTESLKFFEKSAKAGNHSATWWYMATIMGMSDVKDRDVLKKAFSYLIKSANENYAPAQHMVAKYHWKGNEKLEIKENKSKAFDWFQKAADNGNISSCADLGGCFEDGYGTTIDLVKAQKYYKIAADGGSKTAIERMNKPFK